VRLQADRALRDPEILDLVGDDPGLLAIVDAIHCTQPRRKRQHRFRVTPLLATALAAAALVVLLVAPWQTSPGLVSRALAAIGRQPVVHVVTAQTLQGISRLDLKTNRLTPASTRVEVFFDDGRKLERTISVSPIAGRSDELHTATGDWVNGEPVWTCAQIAAHPAAAARARVSCPAGASTRPQPPTLDPALTGFASGYRAALASGKARHVGDGRLNGHAVHWLAIGAGERVAVDTQTLLPVLVRRSEHGHVSSYRVLSFATVPFSARDFVRVKAPTNPPPAGESVQGKRAVSLAAAKKALGGVLLVPARVSGLRFESARIVDLLTGYAGKRPARRSVAVQLVYRPGNERLTVEESRQPDMIAGFTSGVAPASGEAIVRYAAAVGQLPPLDQQRLAAADVLIAPWRTILRTGGIYVTVESWSKPLLLEAVAALRQGSR
jgi:hypothetical protein